MSILSLSIQLRNLESLSSHTPDPWTRLLCEAACISLYSAQAFQSGDRLRPSEGMRLIDSSGILASELGYLITVLSLA
jgi:hypothetical protein